MGRAARGASAGDRPAVCDRLRDAPLPGGKDLALIHGGRRPGLRVDFDGDAPYSRLVVTVADPQATAQAIRSAADVA